MNKILTSLFIIFTLAMQLFAKDGKLSFQERQNLPRTKSYSYFFTMNPVLTVNTASSTKSAPSPIAFSCGFGAKLQQAKKISMEPALSFFTNYYLWDGKKALPAEVENRTATVLSFLIDLPVVYNFNRKNNHYFEAGAGLAVLARYGILSNGVKSSDEGTSGDAQGDVKEINSYFQSFNRMIFPELTAAWNYKVTERLDAGLTGRIYIPISGNGLDTMMISVGARLIF